LSTLAVTGHRDLGNPDLVRPAVKGFLRESSPTLTWSMLAAGADQLVAEEAHRLGSELAAVLPFNNYEQDFEGEDLVRYRRLLSRCTLVVRLANQSRSDRAYEEAGKAIVDRGEALVAIWDGEAADGRGGTGDIVKYAVAHGRIVYWIDSTKGVLRRLP
jgi:hypothetical protein